MTFVSRGSFDIFFFFHSSYASAAVIGLQFAALPCSPPDPGGPFSPGLPLLRWLTLGLDIVLPAIHTVGE